jgi:cytochrome c-type biogenesis protein CcmH
LAKRVACPICDGESVFESRNNASDALRNQIAELVAANDLDDAEIIAFIETRYGAEVLLVPRAEGIDTLVWVLPAVAFVCGLAALVVVFRRWQRDADSIGDPTDADRELVAAALAAEHARVDAGGTDTGPAEADDVDDRTPRSVASDDGAGGDRHGEGAGR